MMHNRPKLAMPIPISFWQLGNLYREKDLDLDIIAVYVLYHLYKTQTITQFPCRKHDGAEYFYIVPAAMCHSIANYFAVSKAYVQDKFDYLCDEDLIKVDPTLYSDVSFSSVGVALTDDAVQIIAFDEDAQMNAIEEYDNEHPNSPIVPVDINYEPTVRTGWVYCVYSPTTKLVKIGMTGSLTSRLQSIKTGIGHDIDLICAVQCENNRHFESCMHEHYKSLRQKGEWFSIPPEKFSELKPTLVSYIKSEGCIITSIQEGNE